MKNPNRDIVARLDELPNIGKKIALDLQRIGIDHPRKLIGKSPMALYEALCENKGERVDHCVIDVFMSAVDFMEGASPQPWWAYTAKRKLIMNGR